MSGQNWLQLVVSVVAVGLSVWFIKYSIRSFFMETNKKMEGFIKTVNVKFDELIRTMKEMAISDAVQDEKLTRLNEKLYEGQSRLDERLQTHDKRINDHAQRIREMENNMHSCTHFKSKK
jgi:predicted nuclease with TOPRIM domain